MTATELLDQAATLEPVIFDRQAPARVRIEAAAAWFDNLAAARALDPQNARLSTPTAGKVGAVLVNRWAPGVNLDAPLPEWINQTN